MVEDEINKKMVKEASNQNPETIHQVLEKPETLF